MQTVAGSGLGIAVASTSMGCQMPAPTPFWVGSMAEIARVLLARQDDHSAFAGLVVRHRPMVVSAVRRRSGGESFAAEAAGECAIRALIGLERLRSPRPQPIRGFSGWDDHRRPTARWRCLRARAGWNRLTATHERRRSPPRQLCPVTRSLSSTDNANSHQGSPATTIRPNRRMVQVKAWRPRTGRTQHGSASRTSRAPRGRRPAT